MASAHRPWQACHFPIISVCLTILPGCLFPYCMPELNYVPGIDLGCASDNVHAFRVDVKKTVADLQRKERYELSRITLSKTGKLPGQAGASCSYGFFVIGPLTYPVITSHTVAMRLYRPGYETVELKSWERPSRIAWKSAPELDAQEKAVDDLLSGSYGDGDGFPIARSPETRDKSTAHNESLLFAAHEYARLAELVKEADKGSGQQAIRARLLQKAHHLREK